MQPINTWETHPGGCTMFRLPPWAAGLLVLGTMAMPSRNLAAGVPQRLPVGPPDTGGAAAPAVPVEAPARVAPENRARITVPEYNPPPPGPADYPGLHSLDDPRSMAPAPNTPPATQADPRD